MNPVIRKIAIVAVTAVVVLAAVMVGGSWIAVRISWPYRRAALENVARDSVPLINAINKHCETHGHPPESLEALVPDYIRTIPETGWSQFPEYKYKKFSNTKASLLWYDLGSRNGKPMSGLWVCIDGDPDHAILAITLDQNEKAINARVDRMPKEYVRKQFDSEEWRQRRSRIEMVRSLPEHVKFKSMHIDELKKALGEPDGRRLLRYSPWELKIECPYGIMNWDVFFYWPTQEYPKYIYGGSTEGIGKWCYVHE